MTDTKPQHPRDPEAGQPIEDDLDITPARAGGDGQDKARSLGADAWRELRHNWMFWLAAVLIVLFVVMAAFPGLFTGTDPRATGQVRETPNADAWFGRDTQGYDIYARTIHGARASILVGILTTILTTAVGVVTGIAAAYFGGWVDTLVSRITDVFFAIPLILGGIVFMTAFPNDQSTPYLVVVGKVVIALALLGWPSVTRLMRGSVMQVMPNDYIQSARALGASPFRIIRRHVLPNAIAPVMVVATINLGVYIVAEASLSFLGIGLTPPAISWGVAISDSLTTVRSYPHILFFPAAFLSVCVFSFILLGDAVRDAFDTKSR
ncbi:ABC transporter permease [Janibacter alkaliphilus]|uniref:Oligopeptide transport system permease protein n=1 Tax=Janibacter alkaliphilus TaxID=1069963 RepID=A0A852X763_9MICO|nr:ABC transporter permease [Janibacter alkaliphilus]NYG37280.1 oligopeptide transport system permease protein [Janibacter alkaliphilus]